MRIREFMESLILGYGHEHGSFSEIALKSDDAAARVRWERSRK